MEIINASHKDLESVSKLFDSYRVFYGQPSNFSAAKQFIADRMSNKESAIFLALNSEDTALGFAQLFPAFTSVGLGRIYILNDLYVEPDARRKGIAAMLLAQAAQYARDNGAVRLQLCTAKQNIEAKALYESRGWLPNMAFDYYTLNL